MHGDSATLHAGADPRQLRAFFLQVDTLDRVPRHCAMAFCSNPSDQLGEL